VVVWSLSPNNRHFQARRSAQKPAPELGRVCQDRHACRSRHHVAHHGRLPHIARRVTDVYRYGADSDQGKIAADVELSASCHPKADGADRGLGGQADCAAEDIYGDDYTEQQYELTGRLPVNAEAQAFVTALEERMGSVVRCVPGFSLDVAQPTTIGLGDSFVGGFLAALVRRRTAPWT
jgi:hypothetical protein